MCKLVKWSVKWQMLFNFGIYKCLHTGHENLHVNCTIAVTALATTIQENYFGVTRSADVKLSEYCGVAVSKCNQIVRPHF